MDATQHLTTPGLTTGLLILNARPGAASNSMTNYEKFNHDLNEIRCLLTESGLFDSEWYLKNNGDVRIAGLDPLEHFVGDGRIEGRDPGPDFDTAYYRQQHLSDIDINTPAIDHYLKIGRAQNLPTNKFYRQNEFRRLLIESDLFDAEWYLRNNSDVRAAGLDPLEHFIVDGRMEGRDPGPDFDTAYYRQQHLSDTDINTPAIDHYLKVGRTQNLPANKFYRQHEFRRLLVESELFDAEWYLRNYNDVRIARLDALEHFVTAGAYEHRDPGPDFDTTYYIEQAPGCSVNDMSPIEHYLRIGKLAGVKFKGPSPYQKWRNNFDLISDLDRQIITSSSAEFSAIEFVHYSFWCKDPSTTEISEQIGARYRQTSLSKNSNFRTISREITELSVNNSVLILSYGNIRLRPHAAYTFASRISNSGASAWYADHDYYDDSGEAINPIFKPDFSRYLMITQHYIGPVIAIKLDSATLDSTLELIRGIINCPTPKMLPPIVSEHLAERQIEHVPMVLYGIDEREASLLYPYSKNYFEPIARNIVNHFEGGYIPSSSISIIIPTRDAFEILKNCIESVLEKTGYPRELFDILVVDNGSTDPESLDYLRLLDRNNIASVVEHPGSFNFSAICNTGAEASRSDILVFLNNDTTVIDPDWLQHLAHFAEQSDVGAVGTQLLYPDDTIQHAGIILGVQGVAGHRLVGFSREGASRIDTTREMIAVTGACLAVRRKIFVEVGGFDTNLGIAFNDIEFCLNLHKRGLSNFYLGLPLLYHHESKSRGLDNTKEKQLRCLREAIYTRQKFADLFKNDPFYSPNLSLHRPGSLAWPPRVIKPWRAQPKNRKVLILSVGHQIGHGVGCVVALQAEFFVRNGWSVTVGGPVSMYDREYPSCERADLADVTKAAAYITNEGFSCVIVHTPPFFAIVRILGQSPAVYFYDHGEPPAELFDDEERRSDVEWEKRFCAPLARRVYVISQAIYEQQFESTAKILRNGNSHLSVWSEQWAHRRSALRSKFGFEGRRVVLNVCRFHKAERRYKGIDAYIDLAKELPYSSAERNEYLFILAGRGDPDDIKYVSEQGVNVFANVSDAEMAELYAASDLYVNLSRWEGYNLGIGQALAMGLNVVASDIPAHREFGVAISNSIPELCRLINSYFRGNSANPADRKAKIDCWSGPLEVLLSDLTADSIVPV
ncbi:glycosyltransferase [Methylobacterium sp. WL18]|uniref:glycosyltransferase n=1 Tax=Methylobacterium sp. WL18 TaxID=2603897 RepID=UPI0011C8F0CC|nr:glycosyltransferase [Methylobacterium sp. WL18]TXN71525.1 glycosyltransferase [Methylobacterium sp. WL18]